MNRLYLVIFVLLIIGALFYMFKKERFGVNNPYKEYLYGGDPSSVEGQYKKKLQTVTHKGSETYDVLNYALGGL